MDEAMVYLRCSIGHLILFYNRRESVKSGVRPSPVSFDAVSMQLVEINGSFMLHANEILCVA